MCTATLISSRVILTAAHCFNFDLNISNLGDQFNPPRNAAAGVTATFTINNPFPPAGQQAVQTFFVQRAFVLSQSFGEKDIAVAELDRDVDGQYAPPLQVAKSTPSNGANVQGFGFGCTTPNGSVDGKKRLHGATWQASTFNTNPPMGCKGDSGGPILDANTMIVALFSTGSNGQDVNARPVTHRAVIDRMNAIYGTRQVCTSCPIVSLRTSNNTNLLQAPNNGSAGATINANPTAVGDWEKFRLVQFARVTPAPMPSWVALQAGSGRWVGAAPNTSGQVKTTRDRIFDNEMFFVENHGLGKWSLKTNSAPTRYYITAENGGGGTVSSNRTAFGPWETFAFPFP
jgi:hypothetical protein